MIVAIHQPHYLPWLRYLQKLAACDLFIILDDVQYSKNGWQNRNRVKGPSGPILLTVPVRAPAFKPILAVEIDRPSPWAAKHWKSLLFYYGKAPFFRRHADAFGEAYARGWEFLTPLNLHLSRVLCEAYGLTTPLVLSSSLGVPGEGTERLVALCRKVGGTQYLTGAFAAANHLDLGLFVDAGIDVLVQTWTCPTYKQRFPAAGFVGDLSAVDLLFNEGPQARALLASGASIETVPTAAAIHA